MVGGFYNSRSPAIGIVVLLIAVGFIGASPAEGQVPEEPITVKTMSSDEVEATLAIDPESNEYHVTWQIKSQETVNTINGRALADGGVLMSSGYDVISALYDGDGLIACFSSANAQPGASTWQGAHGSGAMLKRNCGIWTEEGTQFYREPTGSVFWGFAVMYHASVLEDEDDDVAYAVMAVLAAGAGAVFSYVMCAPTVGAGCVAGAYLTAAAAVTAGAIIGDAISGCDQRGESCHRIHPATLIHNQVWVSNGLKIDVSMCNGSPSMGYDTWWFVEEHLYYQEPQPGQVGFAGPYDAGNFTMCVDTQGAIGGIEGEVSNAPNQDIVVNKWWLERPYLHATTSHGTLDYESYPQTTQQMVPMHVSIEELDQEGLNGNLIVYAELSALWDFEYKGELIPGVASAASFYNHETAFTVSQGTGNEDQRKPLTDPWPYNWPAKNQYEVLSIATEKVDDRQCDGGRVQFDFSANPTISPGAFEAFAFSNPCAAGLSEMFKQENELLGVASATGVYATLGDEVIHTHDVYFDVVPRVRCTSGCSGPAISGNNLTLAVIADDVDDLPDIRNALAGWLGVTSGDVVLINVHKTELDDADPIVWSEFLATQEIGLYDWQVFGGKSGGEVDTTDGVMTSGGVTRPVIPVVFRDSARIGS